MYLFRTFTAATIALAFGSLAAFCQQAGAPEVWGGPHASLVMSQENVTLEFDCAQGDIPAPIQPDSNGNFSVAGTYTPQHGGPISKDEVPSDLPATYKGTIHGDTMQLEVLLSDKSRQPPPMTLTKGKPARIVKCR